MPANQESSELTIHEAAEKALRALRKPTHVKATGRCAPTWTTSRRRARTPCSYRLRYFGWVKEHMCPPGNNVFGLILAKEISESMRYALKAVNTNIQVRQLHFEVRLNTPSS